MGNRDILAIGTSAGGVEALTSLASGFEANFPASVLVTIHLPSHFASSLDDILSRAGPLPAAFASEHQPLRKDRIYIAPPGRHLVIDGEQLSLGNGPRENNARPAIDPMLRSAAVCCGCRTVGVVLTGTMGDGASGLWALSLCGGVTVVQDPNDAAFPEMPRSALNRTRPDHVVHLAEMPRLLGSLVHQPAGDPVQAPAAIKYDVEIARSGRSGPHTMDNVGRRSVLSCPDCGGVMWEFDEGGVVRYRCHVGHAYTMDLMRLAADDSLKRALGIALRALDERVALVRKLHQQAIQEGRAELAETWAHREQEIEREAAVVGHAIRRLDQMMVGPGRGDRERSREPKSELAG
jgi:two-component system, chemotaxis family, protein-glutamate methylesterase/glutaminase